MNRFNQLFAILFIFVILVGCENQPEKPALLFSTDFESPNRKNWQPTDSTAWTFLNDSLGNGVYALSGNSQYQPPFRSPHNISLRKDICVTDFVLELDMKQTGRIYGHQDLCVFFGYQDSSHFYYVHLGRKADAHANSIFLVNEAPRVSIATERTEGTAWTTDWHHVKLTRNTKTGEIQVWFDDMKNPVMKTNDKSFLWGKIGVGSFDDEGHFDNIRLWGQKKK